MEKYDGFRHNYYCENTKELQNYLNKTNWHDLSGNSNDKYIIFLSSDMAEYTNDIQDKEELIFKNNEFYFSPNKDIFLDIKKIEQEKKDLEIKQLHNKLELLIRKEKEKKNDLVYINEAIVYYLNGQKVRRYITNEIMKITNEICKLEKKRIIENNYWENCWIYNDNGKKTTNKDVETFNVNSPIETFEREGFNKYKLWEIYK